MQNRTNKLTLTRPKEPEFVTSQRARPLRVKSSAELEEEMLAKIPKFKARPVNKKVMSFAFTVVLYTYLIKINPKQFILLFDADFGSSSFACATKKHTTSTRVSGRETP